MLGILVLNLTIELKRKNIIFFSNLNVGVSIFILYSENKSRVGPAGKALLQIEAHGS